jgi:predicted AAA+ superfamily ATPase
MKIFEGGLQDEKISSLQHSLDADRIKRIDECFQEYLLTGGFLVAMNEYAKNSKLRPFVYRTYQQWVIGDMLKWNKKEYSLKELIDALGERLARQITFHALSALTQMQHHDTVRDYIEILENMDVLFLLHALREDKLTPLTG